MVLCSKHGYTFWLSLPLGSISATVVPAGAVHPACPPPVMFSAANTPDASAAALGADVPPNMNWCAGKLGPWLVWNI